MGLRSRAAAAAVIATALVTNSAWARDDGAGATSHADSFEAIASRASPTEPQDVQIAGATALIASPVPEPDIYALLLAGLGVIGMVAVRRRRLRG